MVGLFPTVPVGEVLNVIEQRLTEDSTLKDRTLLSPSDIMDLLRLVVDTTIFTIQGTLYKQAIGFPMGSNISPEACSLYMEKFESKALSLCPPDIKPRHWYRYVDDVVEVVKRDNITSLLNFLNMQDPKVQFTVETQSEDNGQQHLSGLDVDI